MQGAARAAADGKFVAVMPLRVLGNDPTLHYEAEGVVDSLSAKLFQMKNVHLASPAAVEKINASEPVTKIAHQLGAKLIIQGTMQGGAGDKIDAVLSLSDATGKQLWTKDFSGVRQDLLTIEDQIYNELVTALELKASDEELARNALRPTENVAAYELYLKGRDILRGKRDVKRVQSAVDLYEQAIKKDPAFALALCRSVGRQPGDVQPESGPRLVAESAERRPACANAERRDSRRSTLRWAMSIGLRGRPPKRSSS